MLTNLSIPQKSKGVYPFPLPPLQLITTLYASQV